MSSDPEAASTRRVLRPLAAGVMAALLALLAIAVYLLLPRPRSGPLAAAAVVTEYTGRVENPRSGVISSLQFVTSQTGWLVASTPGESLIWKTADGGQSWTGQLELPYFGLGTVRLQMLDENSGVAVAAVDGPARVYRTLDGGRTWALSEGPTIGALAGAFFLRPDEGWVLAQGPSQPERCGAPGPSLSFADPAGCAVPGAPIVYHVTGAGRTWQRQGVPDSAAVSAVSFVDPGHGWMASLLHAADLKQPFLLRTTDGGASWQRQALPPPDSIGGSQATVEAPRFFSSTSGVVVLRGARSFAYQTEDAGASWRGPVALPLSGPVASQGGKHWFQVGAGSTGAFADTRSLGGDWSQSQLALPGGWSAIQLVAAGEADAWLVLFGPGPAFGLLHTVDAGKRWTEVALPRHQMVRPSQPAGRATGSPLEMPRGVVALLANNHLVLVPPGASAPSWELALAPAPDTSATHGYLGTGHRLAWSHDRGTVYALPASDFFGAGQMAVVDVASGRLLRMVAMPAGMQAGSLAVGPQGQVYLVGQKARAIVIALYYADQGRVTSIWTGRDMSHWQPSGPVSGAFSVYQAELSPDGGRLYYSYTGGLLPQAGVDWVDLKADGVAGCSPPNRVSACLPGLAGFRLLGDEVLVSSAIDARDGLVNRYRADGSRAGEYHFGLGGGFLNDFALDGGGRLFAVGSCGYTAGLSQVTLSSGQASVLIQPTTGQHGPDAVCGQRLELLGPEELVVGRVAALNASSSSRGTLLYVNPRTGSVLRRVEVPSEPVDVAVR